MLDSSFNPGLGPDSPYVSSLAVQADGKILVGGQFGVFNGVARVNIARLNANGSLDTSCNPGTTGDYPSVQCFAVQADGRIRVGGDFSALGGQLRNHLGRRNADGTVDTGFNPGPDNSVVSLAVQADGRILVGGLFTSLAGRAQANLGRLNPNGSADAGFRCRPSTRRDRL